MSGIIIELDPPPEALEADRAVEVLRFWVADGVDHLTFKIDAVGSVDGEFHGAEIWGSLLADVARHIVNAFEQDFDNSASQEQLYSLVYKGFHERLQHKAGDVLTGKFRGISINEH